MAGKTPKGGKKGAVELPQSFDVSMGEVTVCVLGRSPLLLHCMGQKAKNELTTGSQGKSAQDRKVLLKHDLPREYRESVYRDHSENGPTRIQGLSVWFKKGISSMALDLASGSSKTQLGRCVFVAGERIPIYGKPLVDIRPVILSGMSRSADMRTRAILPEWATRITVQYMRPTLNEKQVLQLAVAAGTFRGVGEYRPERGSGTFGQYEFVDPKDPRYTSILKQGRKVQDAMLTKTEFEKEDFYELEMADIYTWWHEESVRRELARKSGSTKSLTNGDIETDDDTAIDEDDPEAALV